MPHTVSSLRNATLLLLLPLCAAASIQASTLPFLIADAPDAQHADQLQLFAQFIGDWDLDYRMLNPDGSVSELGTGHWDYRWIIGGRAMQDTLIFYKSAPGMQPVLSEHGTTFRYLDPESGVWKITWIGPLRNSLCQFTAKQSGADIVLDGYCNKPTNLQRWVFSDIRPDQYAWHGYESSDRGKHWTLEEEMSVHRRKAD